MARAFLAGAAILAGTALRPAQAESSFGQATHADETAMAIPRVQPPAGTNGVGLPQPLPPSEAARIRRIFALQKKSQIPEAVAETARLTDTTLLGHILADRYLSPRYRATATELSDWLGHYADLPDACTVYGLLLKRLPSGDKPPEAPHCPVLTSASGPALSPAASRAAATARVALVRGRTDAAYREGRAAFVRSGGRDAEAAYVAGLAAWRRGDASAAGTLFEAAALSDESGSGLRAAAAFWSARAHIRVAIGHPADDSWRSWMLRAANEPLTLHGMLARRLLGMRLQASLQNPILTDADTAAITALPAGRRAFALLQVQEPGRAEAELRRLWPVARTDKPLARALLLTASAAGLQSLAADIAGIASSETGGMKVPPLKPRGGFSLSPALVYAVTHVESNFNPASVSGAGANGLMQLMPVAAAAISTSTLADEEVATLLRDPGQNLRMGQKYLLYLSRDALAGDNLLYVLASYNAGPNAVQRWNKADADDPLLFMETIPNDETRRFVLHTLINLWMYEARFHSPSPSLDALAAGEWPLFSPEVRMVH
jgi:soluble lytic murein transglycosylase-like protein